MSESPTHLSAVIPAKGTSQRTPGKNRQEILGVPLFLWAGNNLARVLSPAEIFIDSECSETLQLAERAGFQAIKRPEELASNATDGNGLMRWAASQVHCKILIQHMPTMPFLREATLRLAIEKVEDGSDSAFGAIEEPLYLWTESGPTYDAHHVPNSFDLQPTIIEGMGLYVARREKVINTGLRIPGKSVRVDLDRFEAIDIDTPHDLDFARTVAAGLPAQSPYNQGIEHLADRIKRAA